MQAIIKTQKGNTISFWMDTWEKKPMRQKFPELFSFAKESKITMDKFRQSTNWSELFHTPLSTQVWYQLQELIAIIPPETQDKDIWTCQAKQAYSSMAIYKYLNNDNQGTHLLNKMWRSASRIKHKIF